MTPERWEQVYDLFREALPLASEAEKHCSHARCAGDPELRQEVERLLARDEQAEQEDFLAPPEQTAPDGLAVAQPRAVHIHARTAECGSSWSIQGRSTRSSVPPASPPSRSSLARSALESVGQRTGSAGSSFSRRWAPAGSARSIGPTIPELERIVAVKVLRAGNFATPESIARFMEDARSPCAASSQVHRPGLRRRRGHGVPYIVREFIRGVTLADSLRLRRPSFDEAARLAAELADALQYAHENHVIHRDVKSQNIMIDENGQPHLMDFGMAKRDAGEITITMEGQVLGTPAYMPPEQARGEGHTADGRSDIYSLGVVLYQMLTGEVPFRGTNRMLLHQVLRRRAASAPAAQRSDSPRPGDDLPEGDGQGAIQPLRLGPRPGRGPETVPRRQTHQGPTHQHPGADLAVVPAKPGARVRHRPRRRFPSGRGPVLGALRRRSQHAGC